MSNQEILEKAIQKAIDGGWKPFGDARIKIAATVMHVLYAWQTFDTDWHNTIIFNHDFAKALWGTKVPAWSLDNSSLEAWQYHLQQMVISPDSIKYLGENT